MEEKKSENLPPRPPKPPKPPKQPKKQVEEVVVEEPLKEENKPTFEELTKQIEDLRKEIKIAENEQRKQNVQVDADYGEEYVRRKNKKFLTKRDLAREGIHVHCVPVNPKFFKHLDSHDKEILKCTTRPYALSAAIKITLFILAAVLIYLLGIKPVLTENMPQDELFGNVITIAILFILTSFLCIKPSQTLQGYTEVSGGGLFDIIMAVINLIGYIATIPIRFIFILLNMDKRGKMAACPRIGIPKGFGLDEIIEYGVEMDAWASLYATLDRVQNYDKKEHAKKLANDYLRQAQNSKTGEDMETIEQINSDMDKIQSKLDELD